ncbi:hypothetical protein CYMTET_20659, partial [Cymbomonas tetramitiformis]
MPQSDTGSDGARFSLSSAPPTGTWRSGSRGPSSWNSDPGAVAALTARPAPVHHTFTSRSENIQASRFPSSTITARVNTRYCPEVAAAARVAQDRSDRPGCVKRGAGWIETPPHGHNHATRPPPSGLGARQSLAEAEEISSPAYRDALALVDFATFRRRPPGVPSHFGSTAPPTRCPCCGAPPSLYGQPGPWQDPPPKSAGYGTRYVERERDVIGPGEYESIRTALETREVACQTICDASTQVEAGIQLEAQVSQAFIPFKRADSMSQ